MELKKVFVFLVFGIFIFLVMPKFVRADPIDDVAQRITRLLSGAYDVLKGPLEIVVKESPTSEWFLAKVLFLIIIFSLIWVVLDKVNFFEEHKWALWLVCISVSVLSIRWISEIEIIQAILLPYSTIGVAITAGLPFILFFFLVKDYSIPMRKVSWIFFGVIFIGLWYVRLDDLNIAGFASWIYLVTAILALGMFYFDGTIEKWKHKINSSNRKQLTKIKIRNQLMKEAEELRKAREHLPPGEYSHWMKDLNTRAKRWGLDPKTL